MKLSILYRGPLSSCNYGCRYCPFAKHHESAVELRRDEDALERFVTWVSRRTNDRVSILFTPWGEALIRRWYQNAFIRLSRLSYVERVAIQTNLSCRLEFVDECEPDRIAFWATYHPSEVSRERFLRQCAELSRRGIRYSVGVVGLKQFQPEIEALRRELPSDVYLWINAYKDEPNYYDQQVIERFTTIDPIFPINNTDHASLGRSCRTGQSVISVDGDGVIRRCHFIREPLGNIYELGFEKNLIERSCTNSICGCHIGYVHLDHLKLDAVFGSGILERIPERPFQSTSL